MCYWNSQNIHVLWSVFILHKFNALLELSVHKMLLPTLEVPWAKVLQLR